MRPAARCVTTTLVLAVAACSSDAPPPEVHAFRRELADPTRHAIRKDGKVDDKALKSACLEFVRTHGDLVAARLAHSLGRLPIGALPAPPERTQFAALAAADLGPVQDRAIVFGLHTDAAALVQTAVSTIAPLLVSLDLPSDELGPWLAFLGIARPSLTRVPHGDLRVAIVADYGGLDTLVLALERGEFGWTPTGLTWWRPAR